MVQEEEWQRNSSRVGDDDDDDTSAQGKAYINVDATQEDLENMFRLMDKNSDGVIIFDGMRLRLEDLEDWWERVASDKRRASILAWF